MRIRNASTASANTARPRRAATGLSTPDIAVSARGRPARRASSDGASPAVRGRPRRCRLPGVPRRGPVQRRTAPDAQIGRPPSAVAAAGLLSARNASNATGRTGEREERPERSEGPGIARDPHVLRSAPARPYPLDREGPPSELVQSIVAIDQYPTARATTAMRVPARVGGRVFVRPPIAVPSRCRHGAARFGRVQDARGAADADMASNLVIAAIISVPLGNDAGPDRRGG